MKKSILKSFIKKVLVEAAYKDIKSNYPPRYAWDTEWNPNLSLMTLDNLKALQKKAERNAKYYRGQHQPELVEKEVQQWRIYDKEIRRRLRYINKPIKEDFALGYSHGMVVDDPQAKGWRDPLNDPELTGKMNEEEYRFDDFHWLANISGFRTPTNVYYGAVLLGVIESESDGYIILTVDGPKGMVSIKKSPKNKFKTKDDAAKILHQTWKMLRTEQ